MPCCQTTLAHQAFLYDSPEDFVAAMAPFARSGLERGDVVFAATKGVVVVAAAGNSGSSTKFYPAAYADALSVAATTSSDNLYDWSNRGLDWVQVAAPGCNVAPVRGGGYGTFCGTSSATPIVSGIAALALSLDPGLDKDALERVRGVHELRGGARAG